MDNDEERAKNKPKSDEQKKQWHDILSVWLARLAVALRQDMSEERIAVYAMALADLTIEQLERGFTYALKFYRQEFGRTFPVPAEIRDWGTQTWRDSDSAERAWQIFKRIFDIWHPDVGFTEEPPKLDNAGMHAMRRIGGVEGFAQTKRENENLVRKDFITAYMDFRLKERRFLTGGPLPEL